MSRIGKQAIQVPEGVTVAITNTNSVTVKGPKGELTKQFHTDMGIACNDNIITVSRPSESKKHRSLHGTTRSLIAGMVIGVHQSFSKKLEIKGVGYRAQIQGKKLILNVGYSNPVEMLIPDGITAECPKPISIIVTGIDKQVVGEFAANIRAIRKPEPYLGKGIRYSDEEVRRKEGKTA